MKKRVFIAVQRIIDQGGISTAVLNLINEIHDEYELTLCPVEDYISPNVTIPSNVTVLRGSSIIRDAITDRNLLKSQNFIIRILRLLIRFTRRIVGLKPLVILGNCQISVPDILYDAAIAFSGDIYREGRLFVGGNYDLIIKKVKSKRKVAWIHNDLSKLGYTHSIALNVFSYFDAIVTVSTESRERVINMVPEYTSKTYVVYNIHNFCSIKELALQGNPYLPKSDDTIFVTVARLDLRQKRQDRIINVCSRLKKEGFKNFKWYLVGGGERVFFEAMTKSKNVSDIVIFTGLQKNPYPYIYNADAFVLSSQFEGLPMTVTEAKSLCCPVLITNFGSANEALENKKEGCICPNSTEGLYNMIKEILNNRGELENYRRNLNANPVNNKKAIAQFNQVCELM